MKIGFLLEFPTIDLSFCHKEGTSQTQLLCYKVAHHNLFFIDPCEVIHKETLAQFLNVQSWPRLSTQ